MENVITLNGWDYCINDNTLRCDQVKSANDFQFPIYVIAGLDAYLAEDIEGFCEMFSDLHFKTCMVAEMGGNREVCISGSSINYFLTYTVPAYWHLIEKIGKVVDKELNQIVTLNADNIDYYKNLWFDSYKPFFEYYNI